MTPPTLTARQLNRATLARQMLLEREAVPVPTAIGRLVGIQAQWPKPPFVALWSRLSDFRREDLIAAVHDRSVVRATLMRATIHLMAAPDYLTWRPHLQASFTKALSRFADRAVGIDPDEIVTLAKGLYAEKPRTFADLRDQLASRFPDLDERIMGHTVRLSLPLVQVPTDTTWGYPATTDWAEAESWLGRSFDPQDNDTLPDLVRRYLAAFGPATPKDMQTWTGLANLKPVFEALRPQLQTFRNEQGKALFDLPDAPRPEAETPAPVRFLPEFDNVVLAHDDRSRFVADPYRAKLILPGLRVPATVLVDGEVAGTWTLEHQKKAATLTVTPFAKLTKQAAQELTDEGTRLARFLEADAETCDVTITAP